MDILVSFFIQPLFSALNFCIGLYGGKFESFTPVSAVAMASVAAE